MGDQHSLDRNRLVALLASIFPSWQHKTKIDGWDPLWHDCVYIQTPEGQISFHYRADQAELFAHVPKKKTPKWDGHDTEEKWSRVRRLVEFHCSWSFHPQGAFALSRFCERLISDGYIESSRVAELEERAKHALKGRGFLVQAELPFRDDEDLIKELIGE